MSKFNESQSAKAASANDKDNKIVIKVNENAVKEAMENKGKIVEWFSIGIG